MQSLPADVVQQILLHADFVDKVSAACACKRFSQCLSACCELDMLARAVAEAALDTARLAAPPASAQNKALGECSGLCGFARL